MASKTKLYRVGEQGFGDIRYKGKQIKRDTASTSAIIYTRLTRDHWWQFWRPKQPFVNWRDIIQ